MQLSQTTQQLCRTPKQVTFQYHQNQQLNTSIVLENVMDQVIDFKIKCNRPELYLVKPMDGSIYNRETVKIGFKRKELHHAEFQAYLRNPAAIQEKFLVQIKAVEQDALGVQKLKTQTVIILVKFCLQHTQQSHNPTQTPDQKFQQSLTQLSERLRQKVRFPSTQQKQLERIEEEEKNVSIKLQSDCEGASKGLKKGIDQVQMVCLMILFLALGFAL